MNFPYQKVKLVAITRPIIQEAINAEQLISYCARVSNPNNQTNFNTANKLLSYCAEHNHWSIFEMANMVLEIETTRDITRQILRHRSFSFQEFSQRYADPTQLGFINREARLQDPKNRQKSIDCDDKETKDIWQYDLEEVIEVTEKMYKHALAIGIAKEQARALLPEGLIMSRLYMNGSIRSWIHFCKVREDTTAVQKEHVDIANKCRQILLEEFPALTTIFNNNNQE